MKKLNDEQKKLVEDNIGLLYYCLKKHSIDEEYYGTLALGLCKAACSYDSSKGKFSTFAIMCMLNEYKCELRKDKASKRVPEYLCSSVYTNIQTSTGDENLTVLDTIIGKLDVWDDIICLDFSLLTMQEKQIVNLLYQDHNQSEIGRMIGVSQSVISRKIKRIAKKLEGDIV